MTVAGFWAEPSFWMLMLAPLAMLRESAAFTVTSPVCPPDPRLALAAMLALWPIVRADDDTPTLPAPPRPLVSAVMVELSKLIDGAFTVTLPASPIPEVEEFMDEPFASNSVWDALTATEPAPTFPLVAALISPLSKLIAGAETVNWPGITVVEFWEKPLFWILICPP